MKLVVGLGNPGKKYERTRHNAGFWWVERLAQGLKAVFRSESKFHGRIAKLAQPEIWLLLPATYMNESGRAVAATASFYKIVPQEILVVHDELDLPPGSVKLKLGGGLSGHNGLKDIAEGLGSRDFWRLRIGIGHPRDTAATEQDVVDYVLHPPRAEEQPLIDDAVARGLGIWPLLAEDKHEAAMLRLHTKPVSAEE
ncbi:MAG TPA: aminoacyl-tRNA hydrolase [Burkholderiales bacterium]|jgi:PTH1 family peptidyl-tRNA hydrolase|nr:aminoacyl-tRNA hydrolase [Burkholderiales bacterium]